MQAGATRLTVNPDGSVVIDSATNVTIASAGNVTVTGAVDVAIGAGRDLNLVAARNTFLNTSNLNVRVTRDAVFDVGRTLSITNRDLSWKTFEDFTVNTKRFTLDVERDAEFMAENINLTARSNVNVQATRDVIIKGTKINQN